MSATLTIEPITTAGKPTGIVAYVRMPIPLRALADLHHFVAAAYGPDCECREEPQGWLKVTTPQREEARAGK